MSSKVLVIKAQQTIPSYVPEEVEGVFNPDTQNIIISSKPNTVNEKNPMSEAEQSERHDKLLSQIGELENKELMSIITGRGNSEEWGSENSIALSNVPDHLVDEILALADYHNQDSVLHSPSGTGDAQFLKPSGEIEGTLEEGGFTEDSPSDYTDFPAGQRYAYGGYTSYPAGSGLVEVGEPMEIPFRLLKDGLDDELREYFFQTARESGIPEEEIIQAWEDTAGTDSLIPEGDWNNLHPGNEGEPEDYRPTRVRQRHKNLGSTEPTVWGTVRPMPIDEGTFRGIAFNEGTGFTTGEPMEIAFQLLKDRQSPEAKRHKLEYDTKYESSPERVKYREELNRERRRRGIYGAGDGKDVSHTEGGKLTLEGEHSNRARHFKGKGTLRHTN